MNQPKSPLLVDLTLHGILFIIQISLLFMSGFWQKGPTPAFVYPCWLILSTITIFRQNELIEQYQSKLIVVPSILISLLIGFCLINEMTRDFWAFTVLRHFSSVYRILWYQSIVLLLHPMIYPAVWNAFSNGISTLQKRGYFGIKIVIPLIGIAMILWLVRSQNISPDGYDWLKHCVYPKHWARYLREPLGIFLYRIFVYSGMKFFHFAPYVTITIVTILSGVVSTWLLYYVLRYAIPSQYVWIALLIVVSNCGYLQIFSGNIEIYALLHLGLAVYLYSVVQYFNNRWSIYTVGVIFGVLFCTHLSSGWWIPAYALVPYIKNPKLRVQEFLNVFMKMALASLSVCVFFGLFVFFYAYSGNAFAIWEHFWSDEVMFVGADAAMFRPISVYLTFDYYLVMVNEYFYMIPGGILLLCTLIFGYKQLEKPTAFTYWCLIVTVFYLIYSLTWNPDRPFPADWDLFSALTIPALLLILQLISQLKITNEAKQYILYQSAVFSVCYVVFQLLRNHFRVTEWPEYW
jgi:hypothetical protein